MPLFRPYHPFPPTPSQSSPYKKTRNSRSTNPCAMNVSRNINHLGVQINAPVESRTPEERRNDIRDRLLAKIDETGKKEYPASGTCEWIDPEIDLWLADASHHLLSICGGPGRGKTNISTHIVKNLRRTWAPNRVVILEFFCQNGIARLSTAQAVLLSFLHQLLEADNSNESLHSAVAARMDDEQRNFYKNVPDMGFWKVLREGIRQPPKDDSSPADCRPVFVVLDGLDECDPQSIEFLTKELTDIGSANAKGYPMCKVIIVSRPLPGKLQTLGRKIDLDVQPYIEMTTQDIKTFIRERAKERMHLEERQLEKLTQILSERAKGLFMWASLAMQILEKDEAAIKKIVDSNEPHFLDKLLPAGLNSMYSRALLEALRGQQTSGHGFRPEDAAIVLRYISTAFRPLSKEELRIATGLTEPEISAHTKNCRHVLAATVGPSGEETFQLVHLSLKEYLQRQVSGSVYIHRTIAGRIWRFLDRSADRMRIISYQLSFLDHFLIASTILHARDFLKQHLALLPLLIILSLFWLRKPPQRSGLIIPCSVSILSRLLDGCVFSIFSFQDRRAHTDLSVNCIQTLMHDGLKRNNCNLSHDSSPIDEVSRDQAEKALPHFTAYACEYWVQHFQNSDYGNDVMTIHEERYRLISTFLKGHLLHWIEAMSILRKTSKAISSLESLAVMVTTTRKELYNLVHDAKRFLLEHRSLIDSYPLQVYSSALLFSPENSLVRRVFEHAVPDWIRLRPTMNSDWTPRLQTLHHEGHIWSVGLSWESKTLLSASGEHTVSVWNLSTGECLDKFESSGKASDICFSSDLKMFLEIYTYQTIIIRDTSTGNRIQEITDNEDKYTGISSAVFSTDSRLIASKTLDHTAKVWDITTKKLLQTFPHTEYLDILLFSHDESKLATAGTDSCIIRIWCIRTGKRLLLLKHHQEGYLNYLKDICFSHDSKRLASAAYTSGPKIWDTRTGACQRTLDHASNISVAFSPDSRRLVSGGRSAYDSSQPAIKVWDAESGACLQTIQADRGFEINSTFFYDKCQKVVTRSPRAVEVWDLGSQVATTETNDPAADHIHQGGVDHITFSPDSQRLASGSVCDNYMRIWDTTTGKCLQKFGDHDSEWIRYIAISPHSLLLAAASKHNTTTLWEVKTGSHLRTLRSHDEDEDDNDNDNECYYLAFSSDSRLLASVSKRVITKRHGHFVRIGCVITDTTQTESHAIKVWDVTTGFCLQTFKMGEYNIRSVAFSHGRRSSSRPRKVAAFSSRSVQIWDVSTGEQLHSLTASWSDGKVLLFSPEPDSEKIMTSCFRCFEVWDTQTGDCIITHEEAHEGHILHAAFSTCNPSSSMLATADTDSIKVWDISSNNSTRGDPICLYEFASSPSLSRLLFGGANDSFLFTNFGPPIPLVPRSGGGELSPPLISPGSSSTSSTNNGDEEDHGYCSTTAKEVVLSSQPASPCRFDVSANACWITCNRTKVLWLPVEYRPKPFVTYASPQYCVAGSTVAIGCSLGRVLIIGFSEKAVLPHLIQPCDDDIGDDRLSVELVD